MLLTLPEVSHSGQLLKISPSASLSASCSPYSVACPSLPSLFSAVLRSHTLHDCPFLPHSCLAIVVYHWWSLFKPDPLSPMEFSCIRLSTSSRFIPLAKISLLLHREAHSTHFCFLGPFPFTVHYPFPSPL